ncbi:uncharacterized protein AMSG_09740 [Thecamonas trahens ATCC 50062]|uniref:Uncharacterized protein n=1 Tax=Thecamonas trahens ATCC 50062 TaxID=461836 RepID=A0A0L0DP98_THETB|nr:hypothetical protein AMSG_09740 [Thecamonas trahens ATCC 50062]KNC54075.1 hypothetical protein AMSG_09740 [Thecamonas trahens ATCC 50062]|eukprot:XP_013754084.1 hypothetical protein AMSG_09740 [Thecamonas trahens ATCC 50062]
MQLRQAHTSRMAGSEGETEVRQETDALVGERRPRYVRPYATAVQLWGLGWALDGGATIRVATSAGIGICAAVFYGVMASGVDDGQVAPRMYSREMAVTGALAMLLWVVLYLAGVWAFASPVKLAGSVAKSWSEVVTIALRDDDQAVARFVASEARIWRCVFAVTAIVGLLFVGFGASLFERWWLGLVVEGVVSATIVAGMCMVVGHLIVVALLVAHAVDVVASGVVAPAESEGGGGGEGGRAGGGQSVELLPMLADLASVADALSARYAVVSVIFFLPSIMALVYSLVELSQSFSAKADAGEVVSLIVNAIGVYALLLGPLYALVMVAGRAARLRVALLTRPLRGTGALLESAAAGHATQMLELVAWQVVGVPVTPGLAGRIAVSAFTIAAAVVSIRLAG